MEQWQITMYVLAGFGMAAVMGLAPIAGFMWWFARTMATKGDVDSAVSPLTDQGKSHESRLRLLEMKQVRQTAALENLSGAIDRLNSLLQHIIPRQQPLILPHTYNLEGTSDEDNR